MTFSIVAYDPNERAWGVGVASKFLAVGSVVSWAQAGVGAVATQAHCKMSFGPDGLALMSAGKSAKDTLAELLAADSHREVRQVGMVDANGGAASHTGANCMNWAGHYVGEGFTCQGNILAGPQVVEAMSAAFTSASGELGNRLWAALKAGDDAGGDRRGKQGAALLVVKANAGYGGDNDRYLDLRVDDHVDPVDELQRLLGLHHLYFGKPRPEDLVPIEGHLARELQAMMRRENYYSGEVSGVWDIDSKAAFWGMVGNENLEERWNIEHEPDTLDSVALDHLRERFKA